MQLKTDLKPEMGIFNLIGQFKKSERRSPFELDKETENGYRYSKMSLPIDCGEKYGVIYVNWQDGYNPGNKDSVIYVHGKDENGKADFKNQIQIAWEDRFDSSLLEEVSSYDFITVAIEKDVLGKNVAKHFLSAYDAITYVAEKMPNNAILKVRGNIEWGFYNGKTTRRLVPKYIGLYNIPKKIAENESPTSCFKATFTQGILLDRNSIREYDAAKESDMLAGYVPTYIYKYANTKVKRINALPYEFEFHFNKPENKEAIEKLFLRVNKNVTRAVFDGEFRESGSIIEATMDDLSDDVKMLVQFGILTKDEALSKVAIDSHKRTMLLLAPHIKNTENSDGTKRQEIQVYKDEYDESVLKMDLSASPEIREQVNGKKSFMDLLGRTTASEDDDFSRLINNQ